MEIGLHKVAILAVVGRGSRAEDGSVVELVILDAVKAGFMPFQGGNRKAA